MSWLLVCGKEDPGLVSDLENQAEASLRQHNFGADSLKYITKLDRSISFAAGDAVPNEVLLEKLRGLCQFWDVDAIVGPISSHRKYIGPVIVKSKQILFSILKVLLKPTFEKQRRFNAQVIETLVEMAKAEKYR